MKNKGFTLIELLISAAIIGIISAFTFAGYRHSGRLAELENQTHRIVGEIESVRGMSYSGLDIEHDSGERVEEFTIDFYEDHYVLMDETGESRRGELEKGVHIPENHKRIAFIPPEPEAAFYDLSGEQIDDKFIDIELELRDQDRSKTIRVNKIGLVQILE